MSADTARGVLARFRAASIVAGRPFECFCAMGGYSYHSTEALANRAGRRRSSAKARSFGLSASEGPCWQVVDLRSEVLPCVGR